MGLEIFRDIVLGGRLFIGATTDKQIPRGYGFKARNHAKRGGFRAAWRTDKHHKPLFARVQISANDDLDFILALARVAEADFTHRPESSPVRLI